MEIYLCWDAKCGNRLSSIDCWESIPVEVVLDGHWEKKEPQIVSLLLQIYMYVDFFNIKLIRYL